MKDTCATCFYGLQAEIDAKNLTAVRGVKCRRYPPTVLIFMGKKDKGVESMIDSFYPTLTPDGWCGEFLEQGAMK